MKQLFERVKGKAVIKPNVAREWGNQSHIYALVRLAEHANQDTGILVTNIIGLAQILDLPYSTTLYMVKDMAEADIIAMESDYAAFAIRVFNC